MSFQYFYIIVRVHLALPFQLPWDNEKYFCLPHTSVKQCCNFVELSCCSELGSRFHKVGTGSLQINDVVEQDQGTYQCRAENRDDSVDATATLEVHGMHIVYFIGFKHFLGIT
jgi:hypothetical protein